jgi:predicted HD phosphohydrolase
MEGVHASYGGEAVTELAHAVQAGTRARAAGADNGLVLAALLHDTGHLPSVAAAMPGAPHERIGAAYVGELLGRRVGWLVGAHVVAKRALVALDPSYLGLLSPASVESLAEQGGPLRPDRLARFLALPHAQDALALRRWDDEAKVVDAPTADLDELLGLAVDCAG